MKQKEKVVYPFIGIFFALIFMFPITSFSGTDASHTYGGSNTRRFDLDDGGGYFGGADDAYQLYYDSDFANNYFNYQCATCELMVFNGTDLDNGGSEGDFINGSGIDIYSAPFDFLVGAVDEVSGDNDDPTLPVTFEGLHTGLQIKQRSYVKNDKDFAVLEFTVTNPSSASTSVPVKVALTNDLDVNSSSEDDTTFFDSSRNLVVQQDSPTYSDDQFHSVGIALLRGTLDNFKLGFCCNLSGTVNGVTDAFRQLFFEGDASQTGNHDDDSKSDKEVTISADLGDLAPGESKTVAFCYAGALGSGADTQEGLANGLTNLQALVDECQDFYLTQVLCSNSQLDLDVGEECDDGNLEDGDDCSSLCLNEVQNSPSSTDSPLPDETPLPAGSSNGSELTGGGCSLGVTSADSLTCFGFLLVNALALICWRKLRDSKNL